jgi:hypothetical protein
MTLEEIKQAIADGKTVHCGNEGYVVVKDRLGQYLIKCTSNGHCVGLTWKDGITLNGKPEEFFVAA